MCNIIPVLVRENIEFCLHSININSDRIDSWASANGLCIMLSRTNVSFVISGLSIKGNKINFLGSATNLGIVFNDRLSWSSHMGVIVGWIYSMLRNLWAVINSTSFAICMQLSKTYLIRVLLYGCEIFANCDSHDNRELDLAYNKLAWYIFLKGRRFHISNAAYQIFDVKFDNLLRIRCLILFHKIINTGQPEYLLGRIKFARSIRIMIDSRIVQCFFFGKIVFVLS